MGAVLMARPNPDLLLADAFAEHFESVRRFACVYQGRFGDPEYADEIASETFARAVKLWERFDPDRSSLRAWLFGIAANVAWEHARSDRRAVVAIGRFAGRRDAGDVHDGQVARVDDQQFVLGLLSRLRPPVREVVLLVGALGFSYEEAASTLGIPVGTVASRFSDGRRRLARLAQTSRPASTSRKDAV